jgi:hypothetical protein
MSYLQSPVRPARCSRWCEESSSVTVHPAEEHKKEAARKVENFKALSVIRLAEERQRVPTISTTLQ